MPTNELFTSIDLYYALMAVGLKLLLLVAGVIIMHLLLRWLDRRNNTAFGDWLQNCRDTDDRTALAIYYSTRYAVTGIWFAMVLSS